MSLKWKRYVCFSAKYLRIADGERHRQFAFDEMAFRQNSEEMRQVYLLRRRGKSGELTIFLPAGID